MRLERHLRSLLALIEQKLAHMIAGLFTRESGSLKPQENVIHWVPNTSPIISQGGDLFIYLKPPPTMHQNSAKFNASISVTTE